MADRSTPKSAPVEPYIPASKSLPELTVKAVLLGALLAAVMSGANAYLGLKVGMTVSASIPAAVMSMALLRLFRERNILENNLVQTAASAGESLAAGVIFTLPALILLGYWQKFEFLPTLAIALVGGCLGVMFTIPLRRALILEAGLKFPEGVATGEVLKVGESGKGGGAKLIAMAALGGALLKLCQTGFGVVAGSVEGALRAGRSIFGGGADLGASLIAVGYIVGLHISVLIFLGGFISWALGIPLYTAFADPAEIAAITGGAEGYDAAIAIWNDKIRYLGVGAMVTGGLWALVALVKPIRDGVRSSLEAVRQAKSGSAVETQRTDRDTPINLVLIGTVALSIPIFVIFLYVVKRDVLEISGSLHLGTVAFAWVFAMVAGFLFSSVAGYMAGLVGSSNNPISGVTIATILAVSLILLALLGTQVDFAVDTGKALAAAAAAILVGAVVCCAAAIAGDNMQDLKAGQIVGSTPWKQQVMQILGVSAAALVLAPILQLLFNAYGLADVFPRPGMDPTKALAAPQATLMASVSKGVFERDLPWGFIAAGALIAVAIIIIDKLQEKRGAAFRVPVLAVAVGIYLPVGLSVSIFIGGLVAHFANRRMHRLGASPERVGTSNRNGLLFASGIITGEALLGIGLAVPFAIAESAKIFVIPTGDGFEPISKILGTIAFLGFAYWLYKVASRARD